MVKWMIEYAKYKWFIKQKLPLKTFDMPDYIKNRLKKVIELKVETSCLTLYTSNYELQNLVNRLSEMKERMNKNCLNETDIQLINYLFKKEKLENISFEVKGEMVFQLNEPYLSILKLRVKSHFFLKKFVEINDHQFKINHWKRLKEKETLYDIFWFINHYGEITSSTITFPSDEYGFDSLNVIDGKVFFFNKGKNIKRLDKQENGFLSSLKLNEKEERIMEADDGVFVPLLEEFMKQEYDYGTKKYIQTKENVLLPNGKKVSICNQCVFRVKQMTQGGCTLCNPKKIQK